jgi:hypothetical protein
VRRLLLAALLLLAAAPASAAAAPFQVGVGENPGLAVDDAGTIYVGWEVNPGGDGEQVQFCVVPPRAVACGAPPVVLGFPGEGYARSRVSVLLPAPGVVDVVLPRNTGPLQYGAYLVRSTDGGHTFAPAIRLSAQQYEQAVPGPPGRVVLIGGPGTLHVDSAPADGSGGRSDGAQLGSLLDAQFNDIAAQGPEVFAASSSAQTAQAFRLPAGADPGQNASWQPLPAPLGRQPELAGGPAGLVAMLEAADQPPQTLFVQRFEGTGWAPPVSVFDVSNNDFELAQTVRGRLTAVKTDIDAGGPYFLEYATSTDGGVLWSSRVRVAVYGGEYPSELEMATASDGRGAAAISESLGGKAVRVARFTPRTAPVARRSFRRVHARVQVRSSCDDQKLSLVVEAAKGNRQVKPGSVLRRARFGRAKGARRGFRTSFRARYTLHRRHARIPVRVTPRRGKARTLRLRVRGCRRTS